MSGNPALFLFAGYVILLVVDVLGHRPQVHVPMDGPNQIDRLRFVAFLRAPRSGSPPPPPIPPFALFRSVLPCPTVGCPVLGWAMCRVHGGALDAATDNGCAPYCRHQWRRRSPDAFFLVCRA